MQTQANRRMTLQGILHRGGTFFLLTKIVKRCLAWVNLLCCLAGPRKIGVVLLHTILMSLLFLGNLPAPLSLSVSGEDECGVFSAADQDEILESGSMPNRCDAGSSSLRIGCLVDLGESACSQLVNDNGPQGRQLAEKVASKMDGLMIVATMDSGAEYQWELVQGE